MFIHKGIQLCKSMKQKAKVDLCLRFSVPKRANQELNKVFIVSENTNSQLGLHSVATSSSSEIEMSPEETIQIDEQEIFSEYLLARLKAINELKVATGTDWNDMNMLIKNDQVIKNREIGILLVDLLNSDLTILQPFEWDKIEELNVLEASFRKADTSSTMTDDNCLSSKSVKGKFLSKSRAKIQADEINNQRISPN